MDSVKVKEVLTEVAKSLGKILLLKIPEAQISTAADLINKYIEEFAVALESVKDEETLVKTFNPFINNILSTVETLDTAGVSYKAMRRLILNELYGALYKVTPLMGLDIAKVKAEIAQTQQRKHGG